MNELINVNYDTQTVSARELHEKLGATERFSSWFERYAQYGFVENEDYFGCKEFNTLARQELQNYNITIEMAKQLCMLQKSEKGSEFRKYFIDLEKAWNTPEQVMARALKLADITINSLQDKVLEMKPKAECFDSFISAENVQTVSDVAKSLGLGRNDLFKRLRELKILMSNNMPYQCYITVGYFQVKQTPIHMGDSTINKTQTYVTPKGIAWMKKRGFV